MSRSENEVSRFAGTNDWDGTRARIRERDIVPVPIPVPFCPPNVPFDVPGGTSEEAKEERPAQTAWLLIATGGWWKPREIAEGLGLTPRQIHATLQTMSRHKHVVKRVIPPQQRVRLKGRGASERVEYCVDFGCIVPAGLTAKQVLEALKGTGQ